MPHRELAPVLVAFIICSFCVPSLCLGQSQVEIFESAKSAIESGRVSKAIPILSRLIAMDDKAEYFYYRGVARSYSQDLKSALRDLNIAITKNPLAPDYLVARGRVLVESGLYGEAIKDLSQVLQAEPNNTQARFLRARAYINTFQEDNSYSDINAAIRIDPSNYRYYLIRADLLSSTGNYRDSLSDYGKAISLNPNCVQAHNNRGVALARLGRTREAIKDLRRSMEVALSIPSEVPLPGFSINAW